MEVTLRKTKITASILKQMEPANQDQILTYTVLGYFAIKTKQGTQYKVLLKDHGSPDYKLCLMPKTFAVSNPDERGKSVLKINCNPFIGTMYVDIDYDYAQLLGEQFMFIKKKALSLGQIFY